MIVPAYRAEATLRRVVEALLAQRFSGAFEVIVVHSADRRGEEPTLPPHPRLRVEACVPRLSSAAARNLGSRLAAGRLLVFTDADALAPEDWLERLTEASGGRWAVAGAVANGTPESAAGTVEYLVEFFDLNPRRPDPPPHGATCNLLLPRSLWETYGPFSEDVTPCEDTWLTSRLAADGLLRFAPEAAIYHLNRRRLRTVLAHQYRLGAAHARLAVRTGRRPRHPVIRSGVLAAGRVVYLYRLLARSSPSELGRALRLAPAVLAGFGAWGLGLAGESSRLSRQSVEAPRVHAR